MNKCTDLCGLKKKKLCFMYSTKSKHFCPCMQCILYVVCNHLCKERELFYIEYCDKYEAQLLIEIERKES